MKSGSLRLEKEITIDHTNYWPVASKQWEVNTTKSRMIRTILTINENEYIGVNEMKDSLSYPGSLYADADNTSLIIISKEHFYVCNHMLFTYI